MPQSIAVFGTIKSTSRVLRLVCNEYVDSLKGQDVVIHIQDVNHNFRGGVPYWVITHAFFAQVPIHTYSLLPDASFGLPYTPREGHTQWAVDDFNQVIRACDRLCCIWGGTDEATRNALEFAETTGKPLVAWRGGFWTSNSSNS